MGDTVFFQDFRFNDYVFNDMHHRDNSHGVDMHFIAFMKQGRGLIVSGNTRLEIGEKDLFYIPKGCRYHSYWIGDPIVNFDSIGFRFFPVHDSNGYVLQKICYDEALFQWFEPLSRCKDINTGTIGALYTLLDKLQPVLTKAEIGKEESVIENIIKQMHEDPLRTVSQYAQNCGVSETAVYNYFKKRLGKTPNRVRQEIACQKAIELLTTTNYSVEEVCTYTGFSSASYFRKVLFSVTGKTPSQIRKNCGI